MSTRNDHFPALCQFSTAELLDEIERRALGLLCVAVKIEEGGHACPPGERRGCPRDTVPDPSAHFPEKEKVATAQGPGATGIAQGPPHPLTPNPSPSRGEGGRKAQRAAGGHGGPPHRGHGSPHHHAPEDRGTGGDTWYYRIKGSNIMLGALSAAATVKLQRVLDARGRSGDPDWAEA